MNTPSYLALLALLVVVASLKGGVNSGTFVVLLAAAALGAIPWYIGTRDRAKPPSFIEKVLATVWLWLRRLVCFSVGGFLMFGAFSTLKLSPYGKSLSDLWLTALALGAAGVFFFYLGFFGQGHKRSELRDDIRLHAENKQRYRWWF